MADNAKLERLKQQIQAAAEADAKRLIEDAQKQAAVMIDDDAERKSGKAAMRTKVSRYDGELRRKVAESRYLADRKVLMHRNSLVNGLFDDIRRELEEFAASDKYPEHLDKCVRIANRTRSLSDPVFVYCRNADLELAEKALERFGIKPQPDRNIRLGGLMFKYPVKGIFLDLTLDSAFDSEREAFSSRSEMQL